MPIVKVPLTQPVYRNIDQSQLNDDNYLLINGYTDESGATNTRPGLSSLKDLGEGSNNGIDGLYYWNNKQVGYAVSNGNIYYLTYSSGVLTSQDIGGSSLANDVPVSFVSGDKPSVSTEYTFFANGGQILYTDGTTEAAAIADGDAPTTVTHIGWLDDYLLAVDEGTGRCYFSDYLDPFSWQSTSFFKAEGNVDNISAMYIWNREIYLFGTSTIEVWENLGDTGTSLPFRRISGGFVETGTISKYGIAFAENNFYFIDQNRRFVEFNGRTVRELKTSYTKVIEELSTVSDCKAFKIEVSGRPFILFQFPTAGRSFVYDYAAEEWHEWGKWIGPGENFGAFDLNAYAWCPDWGVHLAGGINDSLVYQMSQEFDDDNGEKIRIRRVSGHINYGSNENKQCNSMTLRLKSGYVSDDSEPVMTLRWNDDNKGWSNEMQISLGKMGDYEIVEEVFPFGIYRTRQYEIVMSDGVKFVVGDIEEDVEVLL